MTEDGILRRLGGLFAILLFVQALAFGGGSREAATQWTSMAFEAVECASRALSAGASPSLPDHSDCRLLCWLDCVDRQFSDLVVSAPRTPFPEPRALDAAATHAEGTRLFEPSTWLGSASARGPPALHLSPERSLRAA